MLNFIRGEGASLQLNFAFVYTLEAHAADKWPMKWAVEWPEPTCLEERIACAKRCDEDLGWSPEVQLFVDTMDNGFCKAFRAWPAGCYVLLPTRRLLFIGAPETHDVFFDVERLFSFLRRLASKPGVCPECSGRGHKRTNFSCVPKVFPKDTTCPLCNGYGDVECPEEPRTPLPHLAGA